MSESVLHQSITSITKCKTNIMIHGMGMQHVMEIQALQSMLCSTAHYASSSSLSHPHSITSVLHGFVCDLSLNTVSDICLNICQVWMSRLLTSRNSSGVKASVSHEPCLVWKCMQLMCPTNPSDPKKFKINKECKDLTTSRNTR